jgi:hypothetical protein
VITAMRLYARAVRAWAENNIAEYEAGTDWITPEGKRLEGEYESAYAAVPCRLAALVDQRVFRQLDYLRRTGQKGSAA